MFWVLGTVTLAVLALHIFSRYSLAGRAMRACASNPSAAELCGINSAHMRRLSFMVSAALGALAGCVISPISMTHYDIGTGLAIKGFAAWKQVAAPARGDVLRRVGDLLTARKEELADIMEAMWDMTQPISPAMTSPVKPVGKSCFTKVGKARSPLASTTLALSKPVWGL